jgi:probable phosphoglycerate mutase
VTTAADRLYLVRHGETAWSITGQHTGRTDLPLTPKGVEQAREMGATMAGVAIVRIFTSPKLRARQTCEAAGWPERLLTIEPDLVEWDYGEYEGLTSAEIRRGRPDWRLFRDGCPGGETPAEVSRRADRLIGRLRRLRGVTVVCSHGHFGRVIGARWIGQPVAQAQHLLLDTATRSILGYEHGTGAPAIVEWNRGA